MSKLRRGQAKVLVVALWLGAFLLLSCQPTQPVATPQPAEKTVATPAKPAGTPVAAATKPAEKAAETPIRGGTMRINVYTEPFTLDPQLSGSIWADNSMFDLLIEPDLAGNLTKEGLFKDWTISGDGKTITFKLQGGVKFHDGTDLDAAAVKWNIERMQDPATKSTWASNYTSVASVEVVDSLTARFNLKQPDPLLLARMTLQAGMVVSPAAVKKLGEDFGRKPVGSGPFQFVEWAPNDHMTMKRFNGYWRKDKAGNQLPYLDQVVYTSVTDQTVAFANLRTGLVDALLPPVSGLPLELLPALKGDANLTYLSTPRSSQQGVYINAVRSPFNNKALRQAVALAVDRQGMASRLGEMASVTASLVHPQTWAYDGKSGISPSRDVAKAKAKMAEAGYSSGGLKVKYPVQNDPNEMANAQVIKNNLAEIGIDMEIQAMATAAWLSLVIIPRDADYQISGGSSVVGLQDPGHAFSLMMHSKASRNFWGPYGNPQADQLIDKAGSIYDQKERAALYQQAANILADETLFVPLYVVNWLDPRNKKVRGYNMGFTSSIGVEEAWLAK